MVFILVALFFVVAIAISYWRGRKASQTRPVEEVSALKLPATFYHPGHTFAKVVGGNLVQVGMDDFAKQALGQAKLVNLPQVGRILKQGEIAWEVQVGERKVSQPMPVTGTVVEVNENSGSSWIVKVKALGLRQNLANLIHEAMAGEWMAAARSRFQNAFSSSLTPAMQDGGELVSGFAQHLENDQWKAFCEEFFNSPECS